MIKVRRFRKSFEGKLVHKGVNFDVNEGECLGLVGGSGAGKSVILRSLIGLEKPDSGLISIDGERISRYSERQLIPVRKKVAYVFQGGALFDSMSVYDNLAYPLREHMEMTKNEIDARIKEQLAEFGLENAEKLMPAELSGGMQKRVGLARAIITRPKVVLYDEPTAGLDPFNTKKIQEMILRLKNKGVTSMFVTHDMPSAFAVCDRIALLLNGEIRAIGTIADMKADPNGLLQRFINGSFAY
ncbi:MAG: ABC transporter ATP-binding protein [Bdellovibrionaceae bacterium]|nr:ABC transporter ATP-binding protein [Bdellovibrionales bacterium]MCB9086458.1 ABC transporter ATP-binding protein [Pseudobdellovibrionaceae bacterium]